MLAQRPVSFARRTSGIRVSECEGRKEGRKAEPNAIITREADRP